MFCAESITTQVTCRTCACPVWFLHVTEGHCISHYSTNSNNCTKIKNYNCLLSISSLPLTILSLQSEVHHEKTALKVCFLVTQLNYDYQVRVKPVSSP